jgi:hypothetical protein
MIVNSSLYASNASGLDEVWMPIKDEKCVCSKCKKMFNDIHFHPTKMTKQIYQYRMSQNVPQKKVG